MLLVSSAGNVNFRRRKIGIGGQHRGHRVAIIETGQDQIVVLDPLTGEVLRELTLGPEGTYHGTRKPRGRPRKNLTAATELLPSAMS